MGGVCKIVVCRIISGVEVFVVLYVLGSDCELLIIICWWNICFVYL